MASSRMLALLGLLAVAGYQNRDKLGSMLGGLTGQNRIPGGVNDNQRVAANAANNDAFGGLLGGLAGAAGGIGDAIGDLIGKFSDNGHGEAARTWVEKGPNNAVGPDQLEEALGEDTLTELAEKTGLSRDELLTRLSSVLPSAVDTLTPEGRLPTREEETSWGRVANG